MEPPLIPITPAGQLVHVKTLRESLCSLEILLLTMHSVLYEGGAEKKEVDERMWAWHRTKVAGHWQRMPFTCLEVRGP